MRTITVKIPKEFKYNEKTDFYYVEDIEGNMLSLWDYYCNITNDHIYSISTGPDKKAILLLSDRVVKGQL